MLVLRILLAAVGFPALAFLFGWSVLGRRTRLDREERFAELERELIRIFPGLAGTGFETTWSGVVDCSIDFSPSVGRMGKFQNIYYGQNLWFSMGFGQIFDIQLFCQCQCNNR